jgi:hypothetical protein
MMKAGISDYEMYLYFGYLPRFSEASLDWLNCDFDNDFGKGIDDESWWVKEGVKAIKETMAGEIASTNANAIHIIPLSGGLDSRTILGGLLENLPKSKIIAATYGIPGAWDFEIAKTITRKFGLRHEVFNLLDEKWEIDKLIAAASRLKNPVSVYQSYVRQKINNYFGTDCIYWSGFMGDSLAGIDLPKIPSMNKREAIKYNFNLGSVNKYKGTAFQENTINKILSECPWVCLEQKKFTLDQQLDFAIVERQLTKPIVIFNGFTFKTPFLSKTWMDFISNVPYKWLFRRYIYKKIILESCKELSRLPSNAAAGMPLSASKYEIFLGRIIARVKPYIASKDPYHSPPRTNYVNWTECLRHKSFLQESVYTMLQDLKKRAIFNEKEIDTWWYDHLNRKVDHTKLLMNLSSLELLLKAGVM